MLDIIGGHTGVENRAILKTEVKHLEETQDELFAKISDFFGGDAFLMLNPKLIEKSLKIIQKNIHNFNQQQLTLLGTLQNQLPILLEQPPYSSPPLTTNQIAFYQQRIKKQIEVFQQPINSEETFNLDPSRAQKLYDTLIRYSDDPDAFSELRKLVSKARNIQIAINQKNDLLDNAKHLAEEEKRHFQELKEQESIIKKTLFEINDSIRDKDSQITQIASSLSEITQNINRLVDSVKVAEDYRGRYDLATRTQNMLESFKHDLKKEAREQLEIEVNKNLSTILDSNTLINTVKISDEFLITYLDQRGNSIGMGTISAGMKQIAATSLLWALKTVSNKEFPVIIDTPLARIDAQHQANLLERYYPHASKQVIILPTDSELDESKSKKLQKHCYKTFELKNPSGTNTEIVTLEVPNG
jgi:DNA sulfur modification protein DndD